MNYYRNINRDLVQFDFLYFMDSGDGYKTYQEEIETLGGRVFYIPNFKRFISFNRKLGDLLKAHPEYKTVHIHDPFLVRFIYRTLRKNGINHIIVHSHATKWSDRFLNGIRNRLICVNLQHYIDYPFACSYAAGRFLYGNNTEFTVINNAIDIERYRFNSNCRIKIRNEIKLNDKIVFGHVGNFNNQKNHVFLIDVFCDIKRLCPEAVLILIGDGPLREKINEKVENLGISDSVFFLGKRTDVERYYSAMDCFILPSLYEGLPMVGVEAQCNGLPILLSDTITKEIGLGTFDFMSLKESPEEWAKHAVELVRKAVKDRCSAALVIENNGFSIKNESNKLLKCYLDMNKN